MDTNILMLVQRLLTNLGIISEEKFPFYKFIINLERVNHEGIIEIRLVNKVSQNISFTISIHIYEYKVSIDNEYSVAIKKFQDLELLTLITAKCLEKGCNINCRRTFISRCPMKKYKWDFKHEQIKENST